MTGAEKRKGKAVGGGSKPKMSKDAPKRKKIDREKWPHLKGDRAHLDDWCREILGIESCYANKDEGHFRRQYYLSETQIGPGHDVFSPSKEERLPQTPPFGIYMLIYTMKKVKVRMPLTDFEVMVLRHMMVAPSQLHPGGWGFVRGYETACALFGYAPSLPLFFHLFAVAHTQGHGGFGMVTLRTVFPIFKAFADSYKDFKDQFFRVAPTSPPPFWWFEQGPTGGMRPRFPLSWNAAHYREKVTSFSFSDEGALSEDDLKFKKLLMGAIRYVMQGDKKVPVRPLRCFDLCSYSVRRNAKMLRAMADIDRTLLEAIQVEDEQSSDEEVDQGNDVAQGEEGHAENQPQPDPADEGGAGVGGTSVPVQEQGRLVSEEEGTRGPVPKKRKVEGHKDHADAGVQDSETEREPERAEPVTVVAPPSRLSVWGPGGGNCREHLEQIDDLLLTENDQKYLGDREPSGLLNYVLRASLKTASAVRYLQLSTISELEELREKTEKDDQLISAMNKELEEGCHAIEELNKVLDNLKLENEQLKKKAQDGDAVRQDLEGRLKTAEGDVKTGAARLKEVEAVLLKEREQSSAVKKELENRVSSLEADKKKLAATVSKINKASFNNAVSQLAVVNPGLETAPVGYRKVVSEGRIGTVDSKGKFTPTFPEENAP